MFGCILHPVFLSHNSGTVYHLDGVNFGVPFDILNVRRIHLSTVFQLAQLPLEDLLKGVLVETGFGLLHDVYFKVF